MFFTIMFFIALTMTLFIIKSDKKRNFLAIAIFGLVAVTLVACGNPDGSLNSENNNEDVSVEANEEVNAEESSESKQMNGMEVHFIDVGQADAALIQYDNHNILIDAGDWQGNEVVPYLKDKGVSKLDLLVGSHPHADHIGQFDKVLSEFDVEEVWMSGGTNTSQLFERVLNAIESSNASYEEPRTGDTYSIGELDIEVFSPTSITGNLNDDSIVMKLVYGDVSFLFTGDAESKAESSMANSEHNLSSTILKSGHHGSDTSNTQSFVDKVDPEVVVISAADKSKYNHPNKSVVDRFNSMEIDLYATKTHGDIVIKTDGKTYDVTTDSEGKVTPGDVDVSNGEPSKEKKPVKTDEIINDKSSKPVDECIDINKADKDGLKEIKHIGDITADHIVEYRNNNKFDDVNDLTSIKVLGKKKVQDIKDEKLACIK